MGVTFENILKGLANGAGPEPPTTTLVEPKKRRPGSKFVETLTPDQRKEYTTMAHAALRAGLTVFMSSQTVEGFNRLLDTEVSSRMMRRLLAAIAKGDVVLTRPASAQPATASKTAVMRTPATITTGRDLTMVLSVDQLSAGIPFTLKQAAKILNVDEGKLYYRCITGKIHFQKDRSRYYLPAAEVQRLQVIGL